MKNNCIYRSLLVAVIFMMPPAVSMANNGKPYPLLKYTADMIKPNVPDTLPDNKKKPDESIKEVPKSRKQLKPVAIPIVTVKPVLIKPKIIVKPVIKIH